MLKALLFQNPIILAVLFMCAVYYAGNDYELCIQFSLAFLGYVAVMTLSVNTFWENVGMLFVLVLILAVLVA